MTVWVIAASVAVGIAVHGAACAQNAAALGSSPSNSVVLVDSMGKVAARPLNDTIMLITLGSGVVLCVGAIGTGTTVAVHSILYDCGCSPVTVQQNGLLPVLLTVNLSTGYPPPLSFQ